MSELEMHMKIILKQTQEETVLDIIRYLKHHPAYLKDIKNTHPFNHPELRDVDWTKVKEASIEKGRLKLEF